MFHGSIVALVTPMTVQGEIDYDALTRLVDWHLAEGTDGLVIAGTTGEAAMITDEEHTKIIRHVVEQVAEKVPVIAGSGATATAKAIALTKAAQEAGADACLIMAPGYVKPTQEGLFLHYKHIAEAVSIPQILYNVPGRTVCDILPQTVARLASLPNIVGIKEATGDISRVETLLNLCQGKLDLYSGDDATAKDFILAGGKGVISVTANVAPRLMHAMCLAAIEGKTNLAEQIDAKLQGLHKTLFVEANPIPVKWALSQLNLISSGIRLPLTPLSENYRLPVKQALAQAEIVL
jgi:4-hydroxy-tetrahydrodipicolinate synthase